MTEDAGPSLTGFNHDELAARAARLDELGVRDCDSRVRDSSEVLTDHGKQFSGRFGRPRAPPAATSAGPRPPATPCLTAPWQTSSAGAGLSAMLANVDDLELLRDEFSAAEGSFLLQVRCDLHWDRSAFSRLEQAMRRVCAQQEPREQLDRWLVEGYWYISGYVPGWTSHPSFPRPEPAEYYKAAVRRLRDLQNWFVTGRSPYLARHQWADL